MQEDMIDKVPYWLVTFVSVDKYGPVEYRHTFDNFEEALAFFNLRADIDPDNLTTMTKKYRVKE